MPINYQYKFYIYIRQAERSKSFGQFLFGTLVPLEARCPSKRKGVDKLFASLTNEFIEILRLRSRRTGLGLDHKHN